MSFGAWSSILRQLVLPQDAGPGNTRIVIGPELPPELLAYTFRDRFLDPVNPTGAIINYSEEATDDTYLFMLWGLSPSQNQMFYLGKVEFGAVITETDLNGNQQIEGMTLDLSQLSVAKFQWMGGDIETNRRVIWNTTSHPWGEDANNIAGITSLTYTATGSPIFCGVGFRAPRSGSGTAIYSCRGEANIAGSNELLVSPRLREGLAVGAGINVASPSNNYAVETPTPASTNMRINTSNFRDFRDLTPNASYNLTLEHRVTGDSGDIFHRQIKWIPDLGN